MRPFVFLTLVGSVLWPSPTETSPLSIRVDTTSVDVRGDTVRIAYRVTNAATSSYKLFIFTVDAPAPALRVEEPPQTDEWDMDTATSFGRSVASWGFMKRLAPGKMSPPLAFSAVGLPGLVTYWAMPFVAPGREETPDVPPVPNAPIGPGNSAADSGVTVGVVPFPADRSRAALLIRLAALVDDVCARGWVDNHGICNSLQVKIHHGQDAALVNELNAQRGKHVSESAYLLLIGNVAALPSR